MPLQVRSIAVSIAVICFFAMSFVGWASGLAPFVCCKRALIGAVLAYTAGGWAVRAINYILVNAMIANRMTENDSMDSAAVMKAALGDRDGVATD